MNLKKTTAFMTAIYFFFAGTVYAFDTRLNDGCLMLVNDEYVLKKEIRRELVDITNFMPGNKSGIMLDSVAAGNLENLYNAMVAEGLNPIAISGYRNKAYQSRLYDREVQTQENTGKADPERSAALLTAEPDTSEHQIGLAVDISNNSDLSFDFEYTDEGKWLKNNCWKYGFILRYSKNKMDITQKVYEPWHFRYVGMPHAEYMTMYNLSLEEYIAKLHTQGSVELTSIVDNKNYKIVCTDDVSAEFENIVSVSDDNAGKYIVTTVVDKVEPTPQVVEEQPEVAAESVQVPEETKKENTFLLWLKNVWFEICDAVMYFCKVTIPKMNDWRKDFERQVEIFVNKMLEPVYIGGKK